MSYSLLPPPPRGSSRLLSRRRASRRKVKILGALVTALFLFFIVSILGAVIAFGFFARDLPSPGKLTDRTVDQSTKIFDRHHVLLYDVYGEQNRTLVTLDKIPKTLKDATIAIEDKNFYKHRGFDVAGYLRSFKEIIVDHKLTGGSTITQQLVKKALLSDERTVTRKIKEFILATQIERRYSKDEILQLYLNEIPYGGTAWGVEAASDQYFGKHASELNLTESAILAGLPQLPSAYSPFGPDPKAYINRSKEVLRRMREDNYIDADQEKKAIEELPKVKFAKFGQGIKAPHFSLFVKKLLEEKYGEQRVLEGGLQVTTTLDLKTQNMAQKVVRDTVKAQKNLFVGNGAAVVQETKTGQVLALVGSKDYFAKDIQGNYDVATQGLRQPGSALKPFNYLTGFEKGFTPATMFIDERTNFGGGYTPVNYDGRFRGPISVRNALGSSYNIPAVKMLGVNGVEDFVKTLQDFGITTLNNPSQYGLSLTLGGGAVRLYELTNAYSILGNLGKSVSPTVILKVADSEGNVLEEYKNHEGRQVVAPEHAYLVDHILSDKTAKFSAFGSYANFLNFKPNIAVKTGTSDNKVDNWAFGTTTSYTVGTWVGNNDNSPLNPRLASGITGASPMWHDIMAKVLDSNPLKRNTTETFTRPAGVVTAKVDALSGMKPGPYTTQTRSEVFTKWQVPTQEDDMHLKIRICKPSGLLASPACEAAGQAQNKLYTVLYDPYTKLFKPGYKKCSPCPPTKVDTSVDGSERPTVEITSPADGSNFLLGSFDVTATVTTPAGTTIIDVRAYLDDDPSPIASYSSDPYSFHYSGVSNGNHTVKIVAFASDGTTGEDLIDVDIGP
ncbi:MAG: PBP1A family penicillin-binding protein [bacterium]|nr:PBP1A family penicillin-binding protein [bacterium]